MRGYWALPLCLGLIVDAVHAQTQTHAIDADRAQASFWIRPVWFKRIEGTFPVLEGVATRDARSGAVEVDVRIDVRALQMARASHVTWAQSAEFFDVERHPWIRFRSDPVSPQRLREGGAMEGEVTLRGITRRARFQLEPAACAQPGLACAVRATGDVRRSEFGMDARRIALGDIVHLALSVRLRPEAAARADLRP